MSFCLVLLIDGLLRSSVTVPLEVDRVAIPAESPLALPVPFLCGVWRKNRNLEVLMTLGRCVFPVNTGLRKCPLTCLPGAGVVTHQLRLKCVPRTHVGQVHNIVCCRGSSTLFWSPRVPYTCAVSTYIHMNKDTLFKMYLYGGAYDLCRLGPLMVPSITDGTRSFFMYNSWSEIIS